MSRFKIGDHVRIIAQESAWFDRVGTVKAIDTFTYAGEFLIDGIEPVTGGLFFGPHELILADPHHEMINDPEGQRLVQAIHDRKEQQ